MCVCNMHDIYGISTSHEEEQNMPLQNMPYVWDYFWEKADPEEVLKTK